jgi:hypothetical protein
MSAVSVKGVRRVVTRTKTPWALPPEVIAFSTSDANVDTTGAGDPTGFVATDGWADQDPHNLTNATTVGSGGTNVYLGGTVQPSVDQKAGSYEADIVLTVAYTGT